MMRYEWKKIFERRLNVVAMLLGYILVGVCAFSYISQEAFYDEKTGGYIEGIEAFRLEQERAKAQTDVVAEEYMTELIGEIQSHNMELDSDEAYAEIRGPLGDIFYFAAKSYTDMRYNIIDMNALNEIDLTDGARFYEQRMKKITDYLNCDFSYGNYKEVEKEYWIGKAENTTIPFRWGDQSVMSTLFDLVSVGFWQWFVIVICASSVFSAEYESGAASLLLTTKYGKDRLIWSKIAASLLFAAGYLTVGALLTLSLVAFSLGLPGTDLPMQLWNSVIPYNLTMGQACLGSFLMLLLIGITIALVLLCCSAGLRSSLATLVIGAAIIIAPAFFPESKKSGLWNHINYLFPVRVCDLKEVLGRFVSYTVGDIVIPYIGMIVIVYTVISVVALLLIRRMFVKAR